MLENWSQTLTPSANSSWACIEWSNELHLFVALSKSGVNQSERLTLSKNGVDWFHVPNSIPDHEWNEVVWSSNLRRFVAVGSFGNFSTSVIVSEDGYHWIPALSGFQHNT